jgi:hypothetical protein
MRERTHQLRLRARLMRKCSSRLLKNPPSDRFS